MLQYLTVNLKKDFLKIAKASNEALLAFATHDRAKLINLHCLRNSQDFVSGFCWLPVVL